MPEISLTNIVDVVSKAGTPKATCVKKIKEDMEDEYDVAKDFYKGIREAIVAAHSAHLGKAHIRATARSATRRRTATYEEIASGYVRWWGRHAIDWFDPPRSVWRPGTSEFSVRVNPELGLTIDGRRHIIKLYLKSEPVSKNRMDVVSCLLHSEFSSADTNCTFSLLDVRRSRLYPFPAPADLMPLLTAELAYIATLWPLV